MKIKYLDRDVVIMHSAFIPFPEWLPALFFSDNHTAIAFLRGNLFFVFNVFLLSEEFAFVGQHVQTTSSKHILLCPHVCMHRDGWAAGIVQFYNEKKVLQESAPLFPCLRAVLDYHRGLCVWHTGFLWVCPSDFYLLKTWSFLPQSMRSDLICLFALCHRLSQAIFSLNSFCCCRTVINEVRGGRVTAGWLVFSSTIFIKIDRYFIKRMRELFCLKKK